MMTKLPLPGLLHINCPTLTSARVGAAGIATKSDGGGCDSGANGKFDRHVYVLPQLSRSSACGRQIANGYGQRQARFVAFAAPLQVGVCPAVRVTSSFALQQAVPAPSQNFCATATTVSPKRRASPRCPATPRRHSGTPNEETETMQLQWPRGQARRYPLLCRADALPALRRSAWSRRRCPNSWRAAKSATTGNATIAAGPPPPPSTPRTTQRAPTAGIGDVLRCFPVRLCTA